MTIKTQFELPSCESIRYIHFIYRCPHRLELLKLLATTQPQHQAAMLPILPRPRHLAGWHHHQPEVLTPHLPRHLVAMLLIPHLPLLPAGWHRHQLGLLCPRQLLPAGGHRHQLGLLCLLLLVLLVMDTQPRHPAAMLLIPHLPLLPAGWHHHQPEVLILLRPQRLVYKQGPSFYLWVQFLRFHPLASKSKWPWGVSFFSYSMKTNLFNLQIYPHALFD